MRKLLVAGLAAACCSLFAAAPATALPGQCWNSPFGGFCDTEGWSDGSYSHCEYTGFGSSSYQNCYRACHDVASARPYMTDSDPATPC